jgi:hypothetical protein
MKPLDNPLDENNDFPILKKMRKSLREKSAPEGYGEYLEERVMLSIAQNSSPSTSSNITAKFLVSFAWLSAVAACFILTFQFTQNSSSSPETNQEWIFVAEELGQVSEDEIQEWMAQGNSEISQDLLLNELSEYELNAE